MLQHVKRCGDSVPATVDTTCPLRLGCEKNPAMKAPTDKGASGTIDVMTHGSPSRQALVRTDSFGVPDRLLGPHTDEFYACVGRVVTLSALVEDRLRVLVGQQVGLTVAPAKLAKMDPSTLVRAGLAHMVAFIDEPSRSLADDFFARAKWAMEERNHIVHNLWPAQEAGSLFGWRSARSESGDIVITRSQSDLEDLVLHIVQLLDDCQSLSMRVRLPIGDLRTSTL